MKITILQLNIETGRFIDSIIPYIKAHNFDLIHLQEVTGGSYSLNKIDCFNKLREATNMKGAIAVGNRYKGEPESYFGNATLYKEPLSLVSEETVWLKDYEEVDRNLPRHIEDAGRSLLSLRFKTERKEFYSLNTHLAWSPDALDAPHKTAQSKIMHAYLATLKLPFILTGDFNVGNDTYPVKGVEPYATNLPKKYGVINTLNPRTHKATHLFPPGLAVDYIFISPPWEEKNFSVIEDIDLSDHLGLRAECALS